MKKIFTRSFMMVALVTVVGFVSSCKDYNDEIMADYRGADKELGDLIENLDDLISDLTTKHNQDIEDARQARETMQTTLEGLINTVQANQALKDKGQSDSIKGAYDSIKDLENAIAKHSDSIKWAVDSIGKLDARIATLEGRVKSLEDIKADSRLELLENIEAGQRLDSIESILSAMHNALGDTAAIKTWASDLSDLQDDVATAKGNHNNLTERLASMQNSIDNIESCAVDCEALDSLVNKVMSPKVDSIAKVTTALGKDVEKLTGSIERMSIRIWGIETDIKSLDRAIQEIDAAYKAADKVLADSIAAVRGDLTELEKRVKANEEAIDSIFGEIEILKDDVADLKDGMKNRISSVLVQGAYSPVVGYFNIPFGMKSNILAAYKGSALSSAIQFPFKAVDGSVEAFTQDIASKLNSETIDEIGDGYAGKLYLTINPAEVDLDSVDFALVNSQDDLAPVKLDSVVVSSDVLKFGYTRAGAPLYEATATITDVNAASLDLNLGDYKDILNDLKNRKINLTEIANTLYSSVNEIADANAVRASWTDSLGEHTVYSDFAVAAVAVKPLSFNTFAAIDDIDEIPGLDRVYNAIDNAINRINVDIEIGEFKDIEVTLKKLNLNEETFDIEINDTIKIKGQTYKVQGLNDLYIMVDGNKQYIQTDKAVQVSTKDTTITFTYNKNLAPEILNIENTVNGQFDQLQRVIDQVNTMLAQINGIETNINQSIADAKKDINNTIHKYLDKLNNKLCNVINSAKDKVNAAMFVKGANGLGVLSQSKNMPTVIENGAVLVPTTYTAELVVPIYKKYVAITAVDGSTANLAAANTGDLNKVLDGGVRAVEFNGESGKTYEVTYAALDYAGYVSTAKYYVTVK